ncbi:MAG: hypothetical protein CEO21_125 [Microgenomates group bacterium Gr01-1014_80]|nr:MAG: hypothetical protein CEO21_125 [Microgenomates group bacterium Gr01-1014_80]
MPASKGFTLIELMVVIAILGILSAIGMVTYQAVNRNSRDAKRQADLKIIQSALEQYHADQFFYPLSISFGSSNSITNCTGNPVSPCAVSKTYLNQVPSESSGTPQYNYVSSPSGCTNAAAGPKCTGYCMYSNFEGPNPPGTSCPLVSGMLLEVMPP